MNKNNLMSYIILSFLTVIFSCLGTLPLGITSAIFAVLLIGLISFAVTRHHYAFIAFLCVCATIPCIILSSNVFSAIYRCSEIVLYSLTLGICYNIKLSGIKTICILSALHIIYAIIPTIISGSGQDLIPAFSESMQSIYPLYKGYMSQADFNAIISATTTAIVKLIPSIFVLAGFIVATMYFGVFRLGLKLTKTKSHYGFFSDCHADKSLCVIYFVLIALNHFFVTDGYFKDILGNVVLISTFFFYVFGLAFVSFVLNRTIANSKKRNLFFALTVFLSLFLLGIPFILIVLLGASEGIFNFRQKIMDKNIIDKD